MAIIAIDSNLIIPPLKPLTTATLATGVAAKPKPYAKDAPLAPWQTPAKKSSDGLVNRLLSSRPLINTKDSLVQRANGNATYTAMFTAYLALDRMLDAAQYATTRDANPIRSMLNNRFQDQIQQLMDYVSGSKFDGVTVLAGLKQSGISSTITPPAASYIYAGATISSTRDDPIPGLTGTEKLTFAVSSDGGATSTNVLIDLSQVSGPLNVDNVASYINAQFTAAGVSSRVEVNRKSESAYGFSVTGLGTDERVTVTSDPSGNAPAIYVGGTSGVGEFANGFLQKFQDVAGNSPTQTFYDRVTSSKSTQVSAVAKDSQGNVYVVGSTDGDVGTEINRAGTGNGDVMLSKYDAAGNLIYQRLLGATADAKGTAITVDASDNVIIAGRTDAKLTDGAFGGMTDSFVTKFDKSGQELWTQEAGSVLNDAAMSVSTDASGNVFVGGRTQGAVVGSSGSQGAEDAYITKFDVNGSLQYTRQFGTAADDNVSAIKVDSSGNLIVAGVSNGSGYVSKYADAATGGPTWSVDLGTVGGGAVTGLAIDDSGRVFVSGSTTSSTLNGSVASAYQGGSDGFVTRIDDAGTSASINFVSYVGSAADDRALGVSANGGAVYLSGDTGGSIGGQTLNGERDGYAAKLDANTGALGWARQFGGTFASSASSIVVDPTGTTAATRLGLHEGELLPEVSSKVTAVTSAREGQYFTIAINGGTARRIKIDDGDTFSLLAIKINSVLGSSGRATATGGNLSIQAKIGGDIQIGAGPGSLDALASLGLTPARLFGAAKTTTNSKVSAAVEAFVSGSLKKSDSTKKDPTAHIYALGLSASLKLDSKKNAEDAVNIIKSAMSKLKDAFRYSATGVDPSATKPSVGRPSAYMQNQIAAYQNALSRIEGNTGTSTGSGAESILTLFGA